jgi:hypothetical protein
MTRTFQVNAQVWLYPGKAGWYFVTIPQTTTTEIDYYFSMNKKGWGSLPVSVAVGETTWTTSIFPDKKTATYLLPLKAEVRKRENIKAEQAIELTLTIKD